MRAARPRLLAPVVTGLALVAPLVCSSCSGSPAIGETPAVTMVEVEVTELGVVRHPDRVDVSVGEEIDFVVKADEPGALHMHTTPKQMFAFSRGTTTFRMSIDLPGVVVVETHAPDQTVLELEAR